MMLKERNLTCAGVLLRMQMDNCMRTYAAFIAEDKKAIVPLGNGIFLIVTLAYLVDR